ncbi:MAG: alpha/beta fold hydrolase [Isosphaeraceae bacterium]|nr:alpha/beta fold hydrolase [Isosphaeraceae bacterium]
MWIFMALVLLALVVLAAAAIYVVVHYVPKILRVFEERPVFSPLRLAPEPGGEQVRFRTEDGLELAGTYYKAATPVRSGVVVFCHEFLSDRWSFQPYTEGLRELGFDLFTFDFRNHGDSDAEPGHEPLQWVSDRDVRDLRAALAYLRSRSDHDPAGVALLGISRGGGAALCVAAEEPGVWGVVTDGAFPTRGTMLAYIVRWAEIYVRSQWFLRLRPMLIYRFVGWYARLRAERRLDRRFPDVERAVARLSPRPWLAIHGGKDAYIGLEIARDLFALAKEPKDLWIVPGAKHNRCRETAPEAYRDRIVAFFRTNAPRLPLAPSVPSLDAGPAKAGGRRPSPTKPTAPVLDGLAARVTG